MSAPVQTLNTILYCERWRETVEFYRDVLRFPVTFSSDWFVEFSVNEGARISVADQQRASIKSAQGRGVTITFHVTDLDAIHELLIGRGLDPTPITEHPWGARLFHLHDPEDHRLEYWTPTAADAA